MLIGVISDTHGLLRPEAIQALHGSEAIVHAGHVGDPSILEKLSEIAPVTAVRGNVDTEALGTEAAGDRGSRNWRRLALRPAQH